jgi:NitT/TauT family transport system ATP-binding protein
MGTAPLVALRGVARTYASGTRALDPVDLDVGAGEFLVLVGPSGCGKSTLLRLIAGLDTPSEGEISRPDQARDVGFVFQDATLMPWATVFDNVFLPLRLQGESRRAAAPRVRALLARVGLDAFADAYPRELSGGMRMRVAIARALLPQPALLLLDEPFAALDEITRFRLNDDLLAVQAEFGTTIIFVTHSIYESAYLASRILVMAPRPGRIAADIAGTAPGRRDASFRSGPTFAHLAAEVGEALRTVSADHPA